jgi:hypothetical protein
LLAATGAASVRACRDFFTREWRKMLAFELLISINCLKRKK